MAKSNRQTGPQSFSLCCTAHMEVAAAEDGKQSKRPAFAIDAYRGGPLRVRGYYYPVVVNLAGLRAGRTIPVLLDHDSTQIVGQGAPEIGRDTVRVTGTVTGDDEPAQKVLMHARNGFAWSASVGVQPEKGEFVAEGNTVKVNGKSIPGPVYVVRSGRLGEVSFVASGADESAVAKVAASAASEETVMDDFEKWLAAKGFGGDVELTDEQRTALKAAFEAEQAADKDKIEGRRPESEGDNTEVSDAVAERRQQEAAETKRIAGIRRVCGNGHAEIEAQAIEEGWTVERAELAVLRTDRPNVSGMRRGGGDQITAGALEAALCLSGGLTEEEVGEHYDERTMDAAVSRDLRGMGLHGLLYRMIRSAGLHVTPGRVDNETIRTAFQAERQLRASSGFSTISLPGILSNVANKALLSAYQAVAAVAPRIAAARSVNDFKQFTSYRLTGNGVFEKVGPDGELKHAELSEESYTNQVDTYGRIFSLTRQMMINDDLGALLQIPRLIGRMSALKLESATFELLLSNPDFFFSAGNGNYIEGVDTALSIAGLTLAERALLEQVDSDDRPILVQPAILLVPPALKVIAKQLMTQQAVNETTTANKPKPANNPHVDMARPESTPYLKSKPNEWYLFADPADIPVIEIAYLRGRRAPTIETGEMNFNVLGIQMRGYFDFGVALQDKRGGVKVKGEA